MTNNFSPSTIARLGENHGYRFEGDFVHLNAEVNFADTELAAGRSWALQLWASDRGFSGAELSGVKVAEMPIQPVAGSLLVTGLCNAMPPAGTADHVVGLALVASAADGQPEVGDLAVYPSGEVFFQPSLVGNVACTLSDGTAELAIDAIANPRAADNVSGTLALEVWALDAPYAGGSWTGSPVASLILGVLGGGSEWTDCRYNVPAALPVDGAALTVMLREWTPAGYVTRDYRNFAAVPAAVATVTKVEAVVTEEAAPKAEAAVKAEPVVEAEAPVKAEPAPKAKPADKPTAAVVAAKPAAAVKAPVEVKQPEVKKAEVKPAAKPARKAATTKATARPVSVNNGSEAELLAVKGLPPSVARAIIAGRPFATLDEVCKAKGMGPKMLAKLRDLLAL
jgi:DNA uptake protein ComE-like DNA-binding protein